MTGTLKVGGGTGASSMHPVVVVFVCISALLLWTLPKKYRMIPFLIAIFCSPFGEQIYTAGGHFFVQRLLILAGWIPILINRSKSKMPYGFTRIDKIFMLWAISRAVATYLEFRDTDALVNQTGFLIDSLGGYFLLRRFIVDEDAVARSVKTFVGIVALFATTMTIEKLVGVNVFGYIGGRLSPFVRDGAIRSQATFLGPIPAGTFGGVLFCLFFWLWQSRRSKFLGIVGMIASFIMVVTSASSTPLLTIAAGIFGIALWPFRKHMRTIRWSFTIFLIALHLAMKAPVWMLIARVDLTGGSSGYHRAALIDNCIRHFADWWLIGVKSTAYWGFEMWDQANQFVAEAAAGGLATLVCFVLLLTIGFSWLGTSRRFARSKREQWTYWLFGTTLFAYVVSFFGISFSDQSYYGWYTLIASIVVITRPVLSKKRKFSSGSEGDGDHATGNSKTSAAIWDYFEDSNKSKTADVLLPEAGWRKA